MKAFVCNGYGSPDAFEMVDVEKPAPAENEVLVRVISTAVNDWEWGLLKAPWIARLLLGWRRPRGKFWIMGCDVAGRVEVVGNDVRKFKLGDEVFGDLSGYRFGGFAEYVCVSEEHLHPKPASMTFEQAAAIPHAAELFWQAIADVPALQPGQQVLINGAAGGVGTLAVQVLKRYGVQITGVDRAEKLDALRALGCDHVIAWPDQNFTRTGLRYDLIIDAKTNESASDYLRALKPNGTYITTGGDKVFRYMALAPIVNLFTRKHLKFVALKPNRNLAAITESYIAQEFVPVIDREYSFGDLREALRHFGAARHVGKVIVRVSA